jgi:endonuclease/exonuclease/phosphatase family metal-dependent hydrolase
MPKSFRNYLRLTIAVALAPFLFAVAASAQKATVKVMTYNLFQGTDFTGILSAQSADQYFAAAPGTLQEVEDSNLPARMKAIAHQIAISQPDIVGLEEATLWRYDIGPYPTDVLYDPLQYLLDDLENQGVHYAPAVVANEYELQGPLTSDLWPWLRANGRNVLLARTDKPEMQISNPQTGTFQTLLTIPFPLPPPFPTQLTIARSWGSVDVNIHGVSFRVFVTHLENPIPGYEPSYQLQQAQAQELNDVTLNNTTLPVIVLGDFNAIANPLNGSYDRSHDTYQEMLDLGFGDAWADRNPPRPGLTWPLINASTADTATQRIDFVFYRGHVNALETRLAGDMQQDKIDGMWPSDHAGLRALMQIDAQ